MTSLTSTPSRRGVERTLFRVVGCCCMVFLVVPLIVVALSSLDSSDFFTFPPEDISGRWYEAFATDAAWRDSAFLTLRIAALTAILSVAVGGLAGVAIARMTGFLRPVILAMVVGPLIVPAVIIATFFYRIVLELHLVGNLGAFVIANTLLTAPMVALLVSAAAAGVDRRLEYASLACGAGPWRTLVRVTLPLIAPAALIAGVFAFMWALGDVVMSILLASTEQTPLAVKMFGQIRTGTSPIVTAGSTLLIVVPLLILLCAAPVRHLAVRSRTTVAGSEL